MKYSTWLFKSPTACANIGFADVSGFEMLGAPLSLHVAPHTLRCI
jgi:hypothetical protein